MKVSKQSAARSLIAAATLGLAFAAPFAVAAASNPCAAKNPCSAKNPCAMPGGAASKNPCAAASGKVDPKLVTRPAGYKPYKGDHAALVKSGEALWKDTKLSTNGSSCATCHSSPTAMFAPTFAKPYPHQVAMTEERAGVKQVQLDEMVQFCMVVPMAAKPLPWDSKELAALTAYAGDLQKKFKANSGAAAPSGGMNPCGAKNPCAARK